MEQPIDRQPLTEVATLIAEAGRSIRFAAKLASYTARQGDGTMMPVYDAARVARDKVEQSVVLLARLGIQAKEDTESNNPKNEPNNLDLGQLATLDMPDSRELLRLLDAAIVVAERVDQAQNNVVPDGFPVGQGETMGTRYAEGLANLRFILSHEIGGAKSGRE